MKITSATAITIQDLFASKIIVTGGPLIDCGTTATSVNVLNCMFEEITRADAGGSVINYEIKDGGTFAIASTSFTSCKCMTGDDVVSGSMGGAVYVKSVTGSTMSLINLDEECI